MITVVACSAGRTLSSVGYNGSLIFVILVFFLKPKSVEGKDEDEGGDEEVAPADMTTAAISLDGGCAPSNWSLCEQELGKICINQS